MARISVLSFAVFLGVSAAATAHGEPIEASVINSVDDAAQSVRIVPATGNSPRPLLVVLHHWSADLKDFVGTEWIKAASVQDWHVTFPDFRGANNRPEACGSELARQDILNAVEYVVDRFPVDESRIYLAGVSGGGHMAMVMAAHAPERWAAVSAWAGISDLAAWHAETKAAGLKYYRDIEAVAGGAPGDSDAVDTALRYRSPVYHLGRAKDLPVDIATGIRDGHTGSVPIHHSIDAFNAIAIARGDDGVDADTILKLSAEDYSESPAFTDDTFGRGIHLRREAGASRVTIFEGGHEGIPEAAVAWLARHTREAE